ncbi:hypothetical protein EDD16DRAFT_481988 [Pisolithus croceorrhizus]|nr:hypothetical protein EDD16DRAFT_481988 [Pisolithus croceorrhizus]
MGRNALIGTARGWQSIRPKPSYTCRAQTQTPRSLVVAKLPPRQRFRTRPSKQLCQCDYVFVSALVVCSSLGVTSYLIFPMQGDYFQARPTWKPVSRVLSRYPLLRTWPTDLGILTPRAFGFRNCMMRVVLWLIQPSHDRQGDTHNFMHSKAMTSSAWKWGVYERTRRC